MTEYVKIFNAAMDEVEDSPMGIALRGALDVRTLANLKVDTYQRQAQSYTSQKDIISALEHGDRLPDIELGLRGQNYSESKDGVITLKNDCYIIDGLQRVSTILEYLRRYPEKVVALGALVHFNTTHEWEMDRFHKLNNNRKRLSPNVTLRNLRESNRAVLTLYGLSNNDADFPIYDRVSWDQNMRRNDLISATLLLKISNRLHGHIVTPSGRRAVGRGKGGAKVDDYAATMLRRADTITINTFRNNVRTYFQIVDEIWEVRAIKYKDAAVHMHGTFLHAFARFLSEHTMFWHSGKLFMSTDIKRKLKQFPLDDPTIKSLCGSGGKSIDILFNYLVEHFNKGRRTGRLVPRPTFEHMEAAE